MLFEKNKEFKKDIKKIENLYIENNKTRIKEEIERVYTRLVEDKEKSKKVLKQIVKNRVYEAHRIASNIYEKELEQNRHDSSNSKEFIFQTIKNSLSGMIYNNSRGYIFISDKDGKNLLQPINKKLENKSVHILNNEQISNASYKIIDTINKKTENYLEYPWFKFNDLTKKHNKISFIKYFEPLNLAIGSGEYIEDFENELKEKVLESIRKVRFGKSGYLFAYDLEGNCLSHFKKELIGLNRINMQDSEGKYILQDLLNFTKENKEGFFSYLTISKPNDKVKSREKISYVKLFNDWNWVIGTGFYLDSLDEQINKEKELLIKSNKDSIKTIIFLSLLITIFTLLLSFLVSKTLEKRFLNYKLRLEKERIRLIQAQETALLGEWEYDIKNKKYFWSNEVLKMFGIKEIGNNTIEKYLKKVIHPEDLKKVNEAFNNTIQTGEEYSLIYRIYKPNGDISWIRNKAYLNKEKEIIIGISQNISELKKLEEEKQQKDELLYQQSKMAAMGEMLANIAHQWRQPLSTISTAATGAKIQKEMDYLTDSQLYSALDAINNSAQYLSQTIDDFKGFFNPNNNKLSSFNISKTINKTLKLISSQLNTKDIKIIEDINDYELLSIENELIQVLINIINNARDALISKEKENRLIFINTYKQNDISYIEILDNAGGIDDSVIHRIFEPYFTTKHQSQGTGIGLYMSHDIITSHLKGNIIVSNEIYQYNNIECKGAKFTIKIK